MSIVRVDTVSYAAAGFGDTLTHDLAYGVPAAQAFFPAQSAETVMRQIDARFYPRAAVCDVLERSAREFGAPEPSLRNIAALREPGTYVVATGQQSGFLGGPLFTLHKALHAIRLARSLEEQSGGRARVVPLFWVASDDHDLAEIDHAYILQPDAALTRVRVSLAPESLGCCACDARVDPASLNGLRAQLAAVLRDEAGAEQYAALYATRTLGTAFTSLMLRWLGGLGLVVAQAPDVRCFGRDVLLRELNTFDITARLVQEAALSLQRAGYKPGFSVQGRAAPHCFLEAAQKIRAHIDPTADDGVLFQERSQAFAARGLAPRQYSRQQLTELIETHPELFSASAALRPVLQQTVFPVVAAVLGPGEIAYWAQLRAVHAHFGAVWPIVVPRTSATLIDSAGEKAMRKLGVAPGSADLFLDAAALEKRAVPVQQVSGGLEARIARIVSELDAIDAEVSATDAGLKPLFQKARERIGHELARIAEKTRASLGQREGPAAARAKYLAALVRPKGLPQERVLATGALLAARPELPAELLAVIDPVRREHLVITMG